MNVAISRQFVGFLSTFELLDHLVGSEKDPAAVKLGV